MGITYFDSASVGYFFKFRHTLNKVYILFRLLINQPVFPAEFRKKGLFVPEPGGNPAKFYFLNLSGDIS